MEFLRHSWAQARVFLSQVSLTTRWLIGCLLIILVLVGWLMMQYVATPQLIPITRFATDRRPQVIATLRAMGIQAVTEAGQLMVPADKYDQALVILVSNDLLAADTSEAFDQLINRQSPWQSNAQNARAFMLAKQKVLGQIITKMVGVRSANVILSMPSRQGFGATHVHPTASVNVVMAGPKRVEKPLVEAVAGLVSGAVAEMQAKDVVVIDANQGRQFTVKSAQDILPDESLELVHQLEQRYYDKVTQVLSYIPGVIVAVNVRVDPVHSKQTEEFNYEQSEPLKSEFTRETQRSQADPAAEPGARTNTGLDLGSESTPTNLEQVSENRNEYYDKNLTRRTHTTEVGHTTRQIGVTVNVPRGYFVGVYQQGRQDKEDAQSQTPDDAAIQPIIEAQLAQIEAQVQPLIGTAGGDGVVHAHMIPDRSQLQARMGLVETAGPTGGIGMILGTPWVKPLGLAMLSLLSLGMMFGMVRKATQKAPMPSIEELAGVPPTLHAEDEMIGEAESSDASMDGLELDDTEVELRNITNQITEMIKTHPDEAAQLFNRWIHAEE